MYLYIYIYVGTYIWSCPSPIISFDEGRLLTLDLHYPAVTVFRQGPIYTININECIYVLIYLVLYIYRKVSIYIYIFIYVYMTIPCHLPCKQSSSQASRRWSNSSTSLLPNVVFPRKPWQLGDDMGWILMETKFMLHHYVVLCWVVGCWLLVDCVCCCCCCCCCCCSALLNVFVHTIQWRSPMGLPLDFPDEIQDYLPANTVLNRTCL